MQYNTVYVGNFPYDTTPDYLRHVLNSCGIVQYIKFIYDQETGYSKGFAFCKFATKSGALFAVENLNGVFLNGRKLRVYWAHEKQQLHN
uniref:RRM domain-containing protein n=1 Tax=Panagrolaimus sp. ES5 TaxID=591445 RepID=A0AC34FL57_9BILA